MVVTAPRSQEVQLGLLYREVSIVPETIDLEKRTVQVCWSTGAKARTYSWDIGAFNEELEMTEDACDLRRLNNGAPLLLDHVRNRDNHAGASLRGWIKSKKGYAEVQFSDRDDKRIDGAWRDVQTKILRNVSMGYRVRKYKETTKPGETTRTLVAIDWEVYEITLLPVQEDAGAQVRSGSEHTSCVIESNTMTPEEKAKLDAEEKQRALDEKTRTDKAVADALANKAAADAAAAERTRAAGAAKTPEEVAQAAVAAERERTAGIRLAQRKLHLPDAIGDDLITRGIGIDQARTAMIDKAAEVQQANKIAGNHATRVEVGTEEAEMMLRGIENGLSARLGIAGVKLDDNGKRFRYRKLMELGRMCLEAKGVNTDVMSSLELSQRALMSASDFPKLLANLANKMLMKGYEAQPQTFAPLTRKVSASDFKPLTRVKLGRGPGLIKVTENGEFQRGALTEGQEVYALSTYGRIVGLSRKMMINDDLDGFARLPENFGQAAKNLESDLVWALITGNVTMGDAVALFHATHGNLGSVALGIAGLDDLRTKMRMQKDFGDTATYISLNPVSLIVPPQLEVEAWQLTAATVIPTVQTNANPFVAQFKNVLVEPRLGAASATAYYIAAAPGQVDVIETATLEGNESVYLETREGFETDGMEIKARHDFAAAVMDWVGLAKSTG